MSVTEMETGSELFVKCEERMRRMKNEAVQRLKSRQHCQNRLRRRAGECQTRRLLYPVKASTYQQNENRTLYKQGAFVTLFAELNFPDSIP